MLHKQMKKSDLEIFLKQYNMWYRGMPIFEMQQCRQVLENSLNESSLSDTSTTNTPIKESDGHLTTSNVGSVPSCSYEINSTSETNIRCAMQPVKTTTTLLQSSSPRSNTSSHRFIVYADVHHPMDWLPEKDDSKEHDV